MRKIRRGLCRKSQEIDFEASSATGGYDGVLVEELDYPAELRLGLMTVTQKSAVYHVAVDGVWQLSLHNPATTATVIEASTNLIDWQSAWTNLIPAELLQFPDSDSTNAPMRFYRAVIPGR